MNYSCLFIITINSNFCSARQISSCTFFWNLAKPFSHTTHLMVCFIALAWMTGLDFFLYLCVVLHSSTSERSVQLPWRTYWTLKHIPDYQYVIFINNNSWWENNSSTLLHIVKKEYQSFFSLRDRSDKKRCICQIIYNSSVSLSFSK